MVCKLVLDVILVLIGVLAFVVSQLALRLLVEPIYDHRKIISKIVAATVIYRNVRHENHVMYSPQNRDAYFAKVKETSLVILNLAGDLVANRNIIIGYEKLSRINLVCDDNTVLETSRALVCWSKSIGPNTRQDIPEDQINQIVNLLTVKHVWGGK